MKKFTWLALTLVFASLGAQAQNIIRVTAPIGASPFKDEWVAADTAYGDWIDSGSPTCAMSPSNTALQLGSNRQSVNCTQRQTQSVQPQEYNPLRKKFRHAGVASTNTQSIVKTGVGRTVYCAYSSVNPVSQWVDIYPGGTSVYYQGLSISSTGNGKETGEFSYGGNTYVRGSLQRNAQNWQYYYLACRVS